MKKLALFFNLFICICAFSQIDESFSDGDFTQNPTWSGMVENFIVNSQLQLQSNALTTSTSYLTTPNVAIDNAVWEFWIGIKYNTSSSNYAMVYVASNTSDLLNDVNGYYIQIGGTNDEVSLYIQNGTKKTKIIDGRDKILDTSDNSVYVRLTRTENGEWNLYSRLAAENDFVLEGSVVDNTFKTSAYTGLLFRNSSTTGKAYYFDNIRVTGQEAKDTDGPIWTTLTMEQPNKLILTFSEPIHTADATFSIIELTQNQAKDISEIATNSTQTEIILTLVEYFDDKNIYELTLNNITDLAGNSLVGENTKQVGEWQKPEIGDVSFNEIMFNHPTASAEYVEIVNLTNKVFNVADIKVTTRKSDGSFNTGNSFPENSLLFAQAEIAICENAHLVAQYHNCPTNANIKTTKWSQVLNNDENTLYLIDPANNTILDSVSYSAKWHHILIKNDKGVALEKINPTLASMDASTWHSASSETNYGTPGYRNSQFREINSVCDQSNYVWLEPEAFSPDGDGYEDICLIHYTMPSNGYMANIHIYTPTGILLHTIANNVLLSADGFFSWDGITKNGKNANIGVYVLVFEAFNTNNGKTIKRKLPIVVGGK